MYQVNDTILYGSHGACSITEIVHRSFGSQTVEYYVLKPVFSNGSTIYVPVNNQALTDKMRRILSAEEIHELIHSMPGEECTWIEVENERKEAFREVLAQGDRRELVRMIKSLYQHRQEQQEKGKRLHASDERFFKDAEKMLYEEFAFVLKLDPDQILPFILEQIEIGESKPIKE